MYCHYANTHQVLQSLKGVFERQATIDRGIEGVRPGILALFSHRGVGVTSLVRRWAADHLITQGKAKVPQIVYSTLSASRLAGLKKGVFTTPATCIVFSEIVYGLGAVSASHGSYWADKTWYARPKSLYTDQQFRSLYNFVRSDIRRLGVKAIIVDNAQLLDDYAFEQLMLLWESLEQQFLLVLAGQLEPRATIDEALRRPLAHMPGYQRSFEPFLELQRMSEAEFKDPEFQGGVLLDLLVQLRATFDMSAGMERVEAMQQMWWAETQGDWELIVQRQRQFAHALREQTTRIRIITPALFERVMGKPLPPPRSS